MFSVGQQGGYEKIFYSRALSRAEPLRRLAPRYPAVDEADENLLHRLSADLPLRRVRRRGLVQSRR